MRIRMPVYSKGSIVNGTVNYQRAAARRRVAEHPREGICVGFFFSRIFLPGQLFALIAEHPLGGREYGIGSGERFFLLGFFRDSEWVRVWFREAFLTSDPICAFGTLIATSYIIINRWFVTFQW